MVCPRPLCGLVTPYESMRTRYAGSSVSMPNGGMRLVRGGDQHQPGLHRRPLLHRTHAVPRKSQTRPHAQSEDARDRLLRIVPLPPRRARYLAGKACATGLECPRSCDGGLSTRTISPKLPNATPSSPRSIRGGASFGHELVTWGPSFRERHIGTCPNGWPSIWVVSILN